jgi:hypothetical protein
LRPQAIGQALSEQRLTVAVISPEDVRSLDGYDAVIIGSAVYMGHWLDPAKELVKRFGETLIGRPVWLSYHASLQLRYSPIFMSHTQCLQSWSPKEPLSLLRFKITHQTSRNFRLACCATRQARAPDQLTYPSQIVSGGGQQKSRQGTR